MKRLPLVALAVSLSFASLAETPWRHVLFIGSDGMSAAVLRRPGIRAPTIRSLMAQGSWSLRARTILPSSSASNWAAMFQCSGPEQNGYVDWNTKEPSVPPSAIDGNGRYPDIFARFRAARPESKIGYAYEWSGMPFLVDTNVCDFVERTGIPDDGVLGWIRETKPELMVIVFNSPDDAGHEYGWDSPEYEAAVETVDARIAGILAAYRQAEILDDTFVVFTSDHGGIAKGHGGASLAEMERPLVFAGPLVKKGYEIPWVTLSPDVGATIANVLNAPPAREWTGRVIDDIFE